ncbi:rhodanese-like domain-containing protein [Microbispora sp. RL4-1S]|uniref:Rhodanese-like domain-containing protein n=1 Tax=Microbispora oryzae TaxID=2806554 RepID=A0A940WSM3_9ACTN|nr:rhodanese-like domain-containing protein [Microbispora oryzae]MBP2706296.1 rhodanese-like domain-containing protein [Microbispora oryzae]
MTMPEITAEAVPQDAYLLDVREIEEWQAGHAPAATHIPLGDLQRRVDELPADRTVYVLCRVGGRSAHATAWLNHIGREAVNVDGGMQSWAAVGRPVISETGEAPFIA